MKPYLINLLNAIIYIILGCWGYLASATPSVTSLIPVVAGLILIAITPGFRKGNRILAHIAVGLTVVMLIALVKPLTGSIGRQDTAATARVIAMMISSLFATIMFVRSFIQARRDKL